MATFDEKSAPRYLPPAALGSNRETMENLAKTLIAVGEMNRQGEESSRRMMESTAGLFKAEARRKGAELAANEAIPVMAESLRAVQAGIEGLHEDMRTLRNDSRRWAMWTIALMLASILVTILVAII